MATDLRAIIFQALRADPIIAGHVSDRIVQRGSWDMKGQAPPEQLPYLVYNMSESVQSGPTSLRATQRYVQLWCHDEPGDYYRIDEILQQAKVVIEAIPQQDMFMDARFINQSPDLFDDLLDHIVRYSRFFATLAE